MPSLTINAAYRRPLLTAWIVAAASMTSSARGEQHPTAATATVRTAPAAVHVGTFPAEVRRTFAESQGLPNRRVNCVVQRSDGEIYAATEAGLARLAGDRWQSVTDYQGPVRLIADHSEGLIGTANGALYQIVQGEPRLLTALPSEIAEPEKQLALLGVPEILLSTREGLYRFRDGRLERDEDLASLAGPQCCVRQAAVDRQGRVAAAAENGLYLWEPDSGWKALYPRAGQRSLAPHDVRCVAFDSLGTLWFASPQCVGALGPQGWTLYTGGEGLPYNDFTAISPGEDGVMWFGTRLGAFRFDGQAFSYRTAPRWLPDNDVHSICVDEQGNAWFATSQGVGVIERRAMTLRDKAQFFESEIDKYHRRTPFGFVDSVHLEKPADKSKWTQRDSDNDGLWTAMYGAGECFAYAATKDPQARRRAQAAFEALGFLSEVTQGGSHPAPPGFPARTILPTSGPNPNTTHYTPDKDREEQKRDPLWKVISPRWPTSADGKWYWKCDTSSDELDGHYFFYPQYYDLVAETDEEKARVRKVVAAITDHLIENDFQLVDHDGEPTRWARFGPSVLNGDILKGCRGLNSLSILSYLKVAVHMTGDSKYQDAYLRLIRDHSYATNVLDPKRRTGPGTGNQSDDEMAFMCYYNILNYETDPDLRKKYLWSLRWYWMLEEPERCPLFNFIFVALDDGSSFQALKTRPTESYLSDAVDTLRRIPLDRLDWAYRNSHRLDVVMLPRRSYRLRPGGHQRNGQVLPVDERGLEHWNQDPWQLDGGGDGGTLTDGAGFLLPYYMGLHHGFIAEEQRESRPAKE